MLGLRAMGTAKFSNNENHKEKNLQLQAQATLSTDETLMLPVIEIFSRLKATSSGLSSQEAEERLETYGRNELARKKKSAAIINFLSRFKSPLVIILMIAGAISAVLGSIPSVIVIYTMVILSVSLAYYQETNASKAAELLREKVATSATVLRDGTKQEIKLPFIVPGDVIYLSAGDITPADARVIKLKTYS